jgi:hypothetical protein
VRIFQENWRTDPAMATINDIVLIYFEEKPLAFARIEHISPDAKPNWYHVKLLLLQVPLQVVTWILRDAYIDGGEFTMNGKKMRLEEVVTPAEKKEPDTPEAGLRKKEEASEKLEGAEVISLSDLKKR